MPDERTMHGYRKGYSELDEKPGKIKTRCKIAITLFLALIALIEFLKPVYSVNPLASAIMIGISVLLIEVGILIIVLTIKGVIK